MSPSPSLALHLEFVYGLLSCPFIFLYHDVALLCPFIISFSALTGGQEVKHLSWPVPVPGQVAAQFACNAGFTRTTWAAGLLGLYFISM